MSRAAAAHRDLGDFDGAFRALMPRQTSLLAACERSLRRDRYWAVNEATGKTRDTNPSSISGAKTDSRTDSWEARRADQVLQTARGLDSRTVTSDISVMTEKTDKKK